MVHIKKNLIYINKKNYTIRTSNSIPGYTSEKNENISLKRYIHPNVYSSIIYNSQDMEAT